MKNDDAISVRESEFRVAIHQIHNCEAKTLEDVVHVNIPRRNGAAWNGKVHVFELSEHRKATRCYAWPEALGKSAIIIRAVLRSEKVSSPEKAVQSVLRRGR